MYTRCTLGAKIIRLNLCWDNLDDNDHFDFRENPAERNFRILAASTIIIMIIKYHITIQRQYDF